MEQKPSIGRIVHFFDKDGICRAGIITAVKGEVEGISVIDLSFFEAGVEGAKAATQVFYHEDKTLFSWHWPERII